MRILLTNDDGIHAEGLAVLERIARSLSDDVIPSGPVTPLKLDMTDYTVQNRVAQALGFGGGD